MRASPRGSRGISIRPIPWPPPNPRRTFTCTPPAPWAFSPPIAWWSRIAPLAHRPPAAPVCAAWAMLRTAQAKGCAPWGRQCSPIWPIFRLCWVFSPARLAPGRVELARRRGGENLSARRAHAPRMFELRRQRFIAGDGGPVIGQNFGFGAAKVHHRLDGKEHAFFQHRARTGAAIVQNIRWRMEHAPQAVAAEIAHHRHAVRLDKGLDRKADVSKGIPRLYRRYAAHQRLMRHLDQTFRLARNGSGHIHPAGITEPAIHDHRHIDVQNIAVGQHLGSRNPVADHMVDRDAGGVLIALVADRRWLVR